MKAERLIDEIRETNLSYLVLAQRLIAEDRAEALFRLGLSEEVADIIENLSTSQLIKIASTNNLMCRFRFDDDVVWKLLTNHAKEKGSAAAASGLHAAIIMAGQSAEVA
ncbi:flagellar transcriptional regulator FlhD [Ampullimonas aquatilis]|uniref:flagellar transcriptional regulator FlhD n=1 Tax=Ampullimonas aquatilis TaxID=1341549 RepID=UPI003C73B36E